MKTFNLKSLNIKKSTSGRNEIGWKVLNASSGKSDYEVEKSCSRIIMHKYYNIQNYSNMELQIWTIDNNKILCLAAYQLSDN